MISNYLNAKELKEQGSLVDLLTKLGYQPVKKSGRDKLYVSMLRTDDTNPSFSVNNELGVWFDYGTRKGGNIIDFGLAYWKNLGFNEVIEKIQQVCLIQPVAEAGRRPRISVKIPNYIVQQVKDLGTHPAITEYLKGRGIFEVGKKCLSEVYYYVEDENGVRKQYFAAGWQNENAGWEVRNKYFKGCMGSKAISFLPGNNKKAALFEGFINYLSWRLENPQADHSIIVLNTLTLLPQGISKAKAFSFLDVYFDRDTAGLQATREFIKALPYASDRSAAYSGFNDYNDKIKVQMKGIAVDGDKPVDFFAGIKIPFIR